MALDQSVRVDIPPHSVLIKNGQHTYIQYTVRAYRNSKGKPTSERISIGKIDPDSGKMIPNRRYYEIFEETEHALGFHTVKRSGSYAAFSGIAEQLGLTKLLRKHFDGKAAEYDQCDAYYSS